MIVEQEKLALILLYSVFLGLFWGVIYGLFKFRRLCVSLERFSVIKFTQKFTIEDFIVFFEDVLFAFLCAVSTCIFIYYMNAGRFRGIVLFGCAVGFVVYYNTIGKLVLKLSVILLRISCSVLRKVFIFTVLPIFKLLKLVFDLTLGWLLAVIYTYFRQSADVFSADMGFGIIRKKG